MSTFPVIFPLRLWPRSAQYALVSLALLTTLTLCGWWLGAAQNRLKNSQVALAQATSELTQLRAANTDSASSAALGTTTAASTSLLPPLPSSSAIDNVVRDMTALAKQHQLVVVNLSIESTTKSTQALAQQQISVQAKGDYASLKRWMGEVLVRHPWLAVKSLNWRSADAGGGAPFAAVAAPLEATFVWVLYVQD